MKAYARFEQIYTSESSNECEAIFKRKIDPQYQYALNADVNKKQCFACFFVAQWLPLPRSI